MFDIQTGSNVQRFSGAIHGSRLGKRCVCAFVLVESHTPENATTGRNRDPNAVLAQFRNIANIYRKFENILEQGSLLRGIACRFYMK